MIERIAKVTSASLGWEDHGILTTRINLDYGGLCQGLPGIALDEPREDDNGKFIGRYGTDRGMEFVARLMRAFGVDEWDKIKGRTVMALIDGGLIRGIKPLPTERGQPFVFDERLDHDEFIPGRPRA